MWTFPSAETVIALCAWKVEAERHCRVRQTGGQKAGENPNEMAQFRIFAVFSRTISPTHGTPPLDGRIVLCVGRGWEMHPVAVTECRYGKPRMIPGPLVNFDMRSSWHVGDTQRSKGKRAGAGHDGPTRAHDSLRSLKDSSDSRRRAMQ